MKLIFQMFSIIIFFTPTLSAQSNVYIQAKVQYACKLYDNTIDYKNCFGDHLSFAKGWGE